jgi:hypothetical protein
MESTPIAPSTIYTTNKRILEERDSLLQPQLQVGAMIRQGDFHDQGDKVENHQSRPASYPFSVPLIMGAEWIAIKGLLRGHRPVREGVFKGEEDGRRPPALRAGPGVARGWSARRAYKGWAWRGQVKL